MERSELARDRIRRRYERARLARGLIAVWPVPILLGVAVVLHDHVGVGALIACSALAVGLVIASWRGQSWRRGAFTGVLAGLPPLVVPAIIMTARGHVHCAGCTPSTTNLVACTLICLTSGLMSGIFVGLRASRDSSPARFAAAALAVGALVGLIACGAIGLGGALGVVVGLAAGGIPAVALARRTA